MFPRMIFMIALLFIGLRAGAQETDQAKIRKTLRLPAVAVMFGLNTTNMDEISIFDDQDGWKRRAAELKRQTAAKPDDPELWLQLGDAYSKAEQSKESDAAFATAEKRFRQQTEAGRGLSPAEQGKRMARWGVSLARLKKTQEAYATLRRAAALAPKDATVWLDLGETLAGGLFGVLWDKSDLAGGTPTPNGGVEKRNAAIPPPRPDRAERALKQAEEARACFDRAISLAPTQGSVYLRRCVFHLGSIWFTYAAKVSLGKAETPQFDDKTFSAALLGDPQFRQYLRAAVRYGEKPSVIGFAAFYEILAAASQRDARTNDDPLQFFSVKNWKQYPEETRQTVELAIKRLAETMVSDPTQKQLTQALRGMLILMMGEKDKAIDVLRGVLKERPTYKSLVDVLLSIYIAGDNNTAAESLLKNALQTFDTVRYRILLAKVYQSLNRREDVKAQIDAAVKIDATDPLVLLSLATFSLQSGSMEDQTRAERYVDMAEKTLPENDPLRLHAQILRGVLMVLRGDVQKGKEEFRAVLITDSDSKLAQELLNALGDK